MKRLRLKDLNIFHLLRRTLFCCNQQFLEIFIGIDKGLYKTIVLYIKYYRPFATTKKYDKICSESCNFFVWEAQSKVNFDNCATRLVRYLLTFNTILYQFL